MKKIFNLLTVILLLCYSSISLAQMDTLYFDQTNEADINQDGTIEHPYENLDKIDVPDNTVCLLKGGVTFERHPSNPQLYENRNVIVDTYGGGKAKLNGFQISKCHYVTIRNLKIEKGGQWSKGFVIYSNKNDQETWCTNITLDSLEISGIASGTDNLYYGLIGNHLTNFKLLNSKIYHVNEDAVDMDNLYNCEFANNHFYEVNLSNKNGDGIQFSGDIKNMNIHDNIFDRSGTTEKFGIIFANINDAENIKIENNEFIGPDQSSGGACIFYSAVTPLPGIIRGNIFRDAPTGVYSHTSVAVGYNTFINNLSAIQIMSGNMIVSNNDFYDNETAINWSDAADTCNISNNIIYLTSSAQNGINTQLKHGGSNIQNIVGGNRGSDLVTIADPLFVDVSNEDFNLQEGSPAIDAASTVFKFDYDNQGNINHCNGTPDIGAFEYQNNCPPIQNYAPVIVPPIDKALVETEKYVLDLTNSYDQDDSRLYYFWDIPAGIDVFPYAEDKSVLALYAPEIESDTIIKIQSYVTDGRLSSDTVQTTISVKVSTENRAPVANAGSDEETLGGTLIELSGEDSYDPDGDNISYFWSEGTGEIALMNVQKETVSFHAPQITEPKTYLIELIVYDGIEMSGIDGVEVVVKPNSSSTVPTKANNMISVYPTIVNESIYVRNIESGSFSVEIISMEGRIVFKLDEVYANEPINVSYLNSGMYKLRITGEKEQGTFSIIKK